MGVFSDNEISSTVFPLLGVCSGMLEPGAEGQGQPGRHFSL